MRNFGFELDMRLQFKQECGDYFIIKWKNKFNKIIKMHCKSNKKYCKRGMKKVVFEKSICTLVGTVS